MITTSIPRRQVWMADDDEFNHIAKNSQRTLELSDQHENHPYVKEFKKGCSVMFVYGTYVLEGEADAKFFWMKCRIYFRETPYQTTEAIFAGK